jgi:hypothetical protein
MIKIINVETETMNYSPFVIAREKHITENGASLKPQNDWLGSYKLHMVGGQT